MKKRGMMNNLQCNKSMIELLNAYLLADVYLYGFVPDLDFTDDLLQILLSNVGENTPILLGGG